MKRIIFLVLIVLISIIYYYSFSDEPPRVQKSSSRPPAVTKPTVSQSLVQQSVFVPYWTMSGSSLSLEHYDEIIYFGISPTLFGINTTDEGYTNLTEFVANVPDGKQTFLTLRMLDSTTNLKILEQKELQKKIIDQTVLLAQTYHFDGVVLDFELSAFPFESVITDITQFMQAFSQASKRQNLSVRAALYGDTFFRLRPFNVREIGKNMDLLYIMSYDFSKARGNPGPNFPYGGKENYGYDFQSMIGDFTNAIASEKLAVVFGMYGYDWVVDDKQNMQETGIAMSYYKIKKNYLDSCIGKICEWSRDTQSQETKLTYTDLTDKKHIVWFEDIQSVKIKEEFLKQKGISHFSFWAYSYF